MKEYICIGYGSKINHGCGVTAIQKPKIAKYIWSTRSHDRYDYVYKCSNCGLYNAVCKTDVHFEPNITLYELI